MPTNRIKIDGSISRDFYSANYLNYMLRNSESDPVTLDVSSYGGDLNEALKMGHIIATHGKITIEYVAFNASCSTVLGLYADQVHMYSDGFYLMHKTMVPIDIYGAMNEDEIEEAIKKLEAKRETAAVTSLTLAKLYAKKMGKTIAEASQMMKEARWMTAEEAFNAGLIDKVIESKSKSKPVVSNDMAEILTANGLPVPVVNSTEEPAENKVIAMLNDLKETIVNHLPINKNKTNPMNKEYSFLNQVMGVEGFEVKNETVTIPVAQLEKTNEALKEAGEQKTSLQTEVTNLTTERDTIQNKLDSYLDKLNGLDDTVKNAADPEAKISAIRNLLEKRPGVEASAGEGSDSHPGSTTDYTPDPVNNFFDE